MCDPVTILSAVAGPLISGLMGGGGNNQQAPQLPATPQASKPPAAAATRRQNATAAIGIGGPSSTLLTGAGGVAPGASNLGTNTLLGQ